MLGRAERAMLVSGCPWATAGQSDSRDAFSGCHSQGRVNASQEKLKVLRPSESGRVAEDDGDHPVYPLWRR